MIDLGGEVKSPQRHAEQEPQPSHDDIAAADAHARLSQVQLEPTDVLECSGLRRSLQKRSKSFAAADVPPLCSRFLDHALAQRADSIRGHRQLPVLRLARPRSSRQGGALATDYLSSGENSRGSVLAQQAIARAI